MATISATRFNPVVKAYYQSLCNRGKLKKVALIACSRKLLVMLNAMSDSNQYNMAFYGGPSLTLNTVAS